MAKKRANGEGNIRKRKDGRWEGRFTAGHDPATGKQIFKNVLGKTQAEVKEKLKKALVEAGQVDFAKSGKYTVGAWMDEWFENVAKIKVRPSSHQTYKGYIDNHIKPNIGNIPLEKLATMDLQKFYRKLLTKGRVERIESKEQPKGLSAKTVRNINQVISSAMDLAVAQKIIPANPTNACELPKVEHQEMQTIPAEQLQAFFEEARATGVYEMYYIELATGLRRGELLGLKWQDIDWKNGIIKVRRQVARVDGQIVEAPLKTKNSYRTVTISRQAIEVLKNQKAKTHDQYVFPSPNGGPISPDSVNNMLKRVLERAGIPKVRFHDLRHPYVKHTTKIFSLRLKFFQAQPVPGALRKTRGAFQHLREGGNHIPFLRSCNKKLSSWSIPQSKISLILYAISMRLSGYTSTLSMRRPVSSAVRPSELKTALAASCRLSCRACSSCFCFVCANTTA